jgi:hypothetical protein
VAQRLQQDQPAAGAGSATAAEASRLEGELRALRTDLRDTVHELDVAHPGSEGELPA